MTICVYRNGVLAADTLITKNGNIVSNTYSKITVNYDDEYVLAFAGDVSQRYVLEQELANKNFEDMYENGYVGDFISTLAEEISDVSFMYFPMQCTSKNVKFYDEYFHVYIETGDEGSTLYNFNVSYYDDKATDFVGADSSYIAGVCNAMDDKDSIDIVKKMSNTTTYCGGQYIDIYDFNKNEIRRINNV